jgi:hypothetical protein
VKPGPIGDEDLDRDDRPGDDWHAPVRPPRKRRWTFVLGAIVGLTLAAIPTVAQSPGPDPDEVARQNAAIVAALVRTTLVALHQANVTGNYTVLRDLAAPSFRDRNTAADLARIFGPIREKRIDLSAIVMRDPRLSAAPFVDNKGMLRIEGMLATESTDVAFQLLYQAVDGAWRLFGISIEPRQPGAVTSAEKTPDAGLIGSAIVPQSLVPPIPHARPQTDAPATN